jgi:Acyl-CoA reductase (LuxC)
MTSLAAVPVRRIIGAVSDAAARWADADFPPRVRLLDSIAARTGYSIPIIEYALDQLFRSIAALDLEATIANELGSLEILDRFTERAGRSKALARPVGSVCVISSRTTIGVAILPAVFALCAKCDVLVKDREDGLVRAFFSTLCDELDEFRSAARAQTWTGDEDAVDLTTFNAVVAFGSDSTLTRIAQAAAPSTFVSYGSKATIGYVAREALTDEPAVRAIADGAARDLVLYESEGCLSLHALFVEEGGAVEPQRFCALLAEAVERAAVEFPPGARDVRASARIANARNLAAFRSATGRGAVFSDEQASYLAVLDPPQSEPPAFLPRALSVHTVGAPEEAAAYLRRHELPLEAIAVAGVRDDVVEAALALGVNRITSFGELQRPPATGNHGGRARIADFVRWVTLET